MADKRKRRGARETRRSFGSNKKKKLAGKQSTDDMWHNDAWEKKTTDDFDAYERRLVNTECKTWLDMHLFFDDSVSPFVRARL